MKTLIVLVKRPPCPVKLFSVLEFKATKVFIFYIKKVSTVPPI